MANDSGLPKGGNGEGQTQQQESPEALALNKLRAMADSLAPEQGMPAPVQALVPAQRRALIALRDAYLAVLWGDSTSEARTPCLDELERAVKAEGLPGRMTSALVYDRLLAVAAALRAKI